MRQTRAAGVVLGGVGDVRDVEPEIAGALALELGATVSS